MLVFIADSRMVDDAQDAKTQGWSVNGSDAGTWVEARNLTYVKVRRNVG